MSSFLSYFGLKDYRSVPLAGAVCVTALAVALAVLASYLGAPGVVSSVLIVVVVLGGFSLLAQRRHTEQSRRNTP